MCKHARMHRNAWTNTQTGTFVGLAATVAPTVDPFAGDLPLAPEPALETPFLTAVPVRDTYLHNSMACMHANVCAEIRACNVGLAVGSDPGKHHYLKYAYAIIIWYGNGLQDMMCLNATVKDTGKR